MIVRICTIFAALVVACPATAQEKTIASAFSSIASALPASWWLTDEIVAKAIRRIAERDRDVPGLYEKYVRLLIIESDPRREQVLRGPLDAHDPAYREKARLTHAEAREIGYAQRMLILTGVEFVKNPDNLDRSWLDKRDVIVRTMGQLDADRRERVMTHADRTLRATRAFLKDEVGVRTALTEKYRLEALRAGTETTPQLAAKRIAELRVYECALRLNLTEKELAIAADLHSVGGDALLSRIVVLGEHFQSEVQRARK